MPDTAPFCRYRTQEVVGSSPTSSLSSSKSPSAWKQPGALRAERKPPTSSGFMRWGCADAERLAEAEPREGVLCDAQRANQIALERLEE